MRCIERRGVMGVIAVEAKLPTDRVVRQWRDSDTRLGLFASVQFNPDIILGTVTSGEPYLSMNGVWRLELLGAYDWEPLSTAFLEDGRLLAASADHYGVGAYEVNVRKVVFDISTFAHGKVRTIFGKKAARHDLRLKGKVSDGVFQGTAKVSDGEFRVSVRATRVGDLP